MLDPIQILIVSVIVILTILLIIIGIEAFKVIKQTQKTLVRLNNVLDDVQTITSSVSVPISKISEMASGLQQGINVVHFITKLIEKRTEKTQS
jgi:uncharacterized protein YoxC